MRKIKKSQIKEYGEDKSQVVMDPETYREMKDELEDDVSVKIVDEDDKSIDENINAVITKKDLINLIKENNNGK